MKKTLLLTFLFSFLFLQPSYSQWTVDYLSKPRLHLAAASGGDKVLFAGGSIAGLSPSDVVDIYDTISSTWTPALLSMPRAFLTAVAAGDKIFVAGGMNVITGVNSSRVDIYDVKTGEWDTAELSEARAGLVSAHVGDKVLFAGGGPIGALLNPPTGSSTVDIYNLSDSTWSTAELSEPRCFLAVAVIGDKAYFAGGAINNNTLSKRVDIYDASENSWTIDSLSQARVLLSGASAGNKVIFAGGQTTTSFAESTVDILDILTNDWNIEQLSEPRMGMMAIALGSKVYFAGGGEANWANKFFTSSTEVIDIYDVQSENWLDTEYFMEKKISGAATTLGNKIYFGGGYSTAVSGVHNEIEIFCDSTQILNRTEEFQDMAGIALYPNPSNGNLFLDTRTIAGEHFNLLVTSMMGVPVWQGRFFSDGMNVFNFLLPDSLPSGVYNCSMTSGRGHATKMLFLHR